MALGKFKTYTAGFTALISAAALLLSGTFALEEPYAAGDDPTVVLHDTGQPLDNWDSGNHSFAEKRVWVSSNAESGKPAFVRVRFLEYLETFTLAENYFTGGGNAPLLFATWPKGKRAGAFMKWDTREAAEKALATLGLHLQPYLLDDDNDPHTPEMWYAQTQNQEVGNGIYGRPLSLSTSKISQTLFGGVAQGAQPSAAPYRAHRWDGTSIAEASNGLSWYAEESDPGRKKISDYVRWNLGANLISFADWETAGKPATKKWVLAEDGWCYWAACLMPGAETSLLMESVQLKKTPGAAFQYEIHVEMQAVTQDMLGQWAADAPAGMLNTLKQAQQTAEKIHQLAALADTLGGYSPLVYTQDSWTELEKHRGAATALLLEEEPAFVAVDTCLIDLKTSLDALVLRGDTALLLAVMDEVEKLNPVHYTPASWAALQTEYTAAVQTAYSGNTTQEMADDARNKLLVAKNSLDGV